MRATGSPPEDAPAGNASLALSQTELAWLLLALACVVVIVVFPHWQVITVDVIWISLAVLYGIRLWPNRRMLALSAIALAATAAALSDDAVNHLRIGGQIRQLPLLAAVFVALAWLANRRIAARDRDRIAAEADRLVLRQRQFLADASHQLRTPITVALGHAELLAAALAGQQHRDIQVVVGELERLKKLSERLLLVAAAEDPGFLSAAPADLDLLAAELLLRWQAVAERRWRLGRLDPVTAVVDAERLGLALDALVENAVRHTGPDDEISFSVAMDPGGQTARIAVTDGGEGISASNLPHVFERFRTFSTATSHGTGLGLALVSAVARSHGGEVTVASTPGMGTRFELVLPTRQAVPASPAGLPAPIPAARAASEAR